MDEQLVRNVCQKVLRGHERYWTKLCADTPEDGPLLLAHKVLEAMRGEGLFCKVSFSPNNGDDAVWCGFGDFSALVHMQSVPAPTFPEAVFRAALKAVGE